MDFSGINLLAVLVSALLSWGLGSLWYSPLMFGKKWQRELDFSTDDLKNANMPLIFGGSFVAMFIMALGVSFMFNIHHNQVNDPIEGAIHGLYLSVFFVSMGMAINYLYQRKTFKLFIIDAAYITLILMLMGFILTAWK